MQPPKTRVLEAIRREAFISIVRVDSRRHAFVAAEGIAGSGFSLVEITLTVPGALSIIEDLVERLGDRIIVGAGTVVDQSMCTAAIAAGAAFIVSPCTDTEVIAVARGSDIVSMSGAQTPTEVVTGWKAGADMIKIFPAGLAGGPAYIRALKAPFPQIEFVPSNGIDISNAAQYLAAGATAVGVGSLIFDQSSLDTGDVEAIAQNARRFFQALRPGIALPPLPTL